MAQSPIARDGSLAVDHPVDGCPGPSPIDISEETDIDVEIVEEGDQGETPGPVLAAIKGQLNLSSATYRIGRSRVTEAELDKYVDQGLLKPALYGLCRAPDREEVPCPEPYEAVVFCDFLVAGLWFPCEDFVGEVLQRFNLQIQHLTPNGRVCSKCEYLRMLL